MSDERSPVESIEKRTPMRSVWGVVIGTVALTSAFFGGYQWWRFEEAREEHRAAIQASETFRAELSEYISYLERYGTSTPEMFFEQ